MNTDTTNIENEMYDLPIIIRATSTVKEGLKKNLEAKAGKRSIDLLLKKTAILGTSHIIREVPSYLFTYLLHGEKSFSRSYEVTSSQLVKKFPAFLWKLKVHYRIHNCPPPVPILSQLDPVHAPHPTS